jgi:hypothetical protein
MAGLREAEELPGAEKPPEAERHDAEELREPEGP